jgi:hypothetical protein
MAKQRFSGAINAASFPFLSALQQRTVVQPQLDNAVRSGGATGFYGTIESADWGLPQLLYCENVLPTAEGYTTVGFQRMIEGLPDVDGFDQVITLRDEDENNFLFAPAGGLNYIFTGNSGEWISTDPIDAAGKAVSRAYVNGRTFVCYEGLGIFEYDTTAETFLPVVIVGLLPADIRGIGASNNYLIAYSKITVHWSSLIDPLDFVPSLATGAGFAVPQDVKAEINAVVGTAGGFMIYTAKNAVAAVYTQNARAPFTFKEIANAGGLETYEQVTSDQNSGPQYAWTTGGMQKITTQGSEAFSAELNDFLAGRVWEYWDSANKKLVQVKSPDVEFTVKVAYVASRYLVISYSTTLDGIYQYALIYDTALKRWGKVKIDHVDCFSYPYPNVFGDLTYDDLSAVPYDQLIYTSYDDLSIGVQSLQPSKRSLAFLGANGSVDLLVADYNKVDQAGVMIFGKFQMLRARLATIQQLDLEAIYAPNSPVTVTAIAAWDGKDLAVAKPMQLLLDGPESKRYAKRVTGQNISFAMEGAFSMTTYILEMTNDGDR